MKISVCFILKLKDFCNIVYIFNGKKQTLVDTIGILAALRMRGLHDKRHHLAKLRLCASENYGRKMSARSETHLNTLTLQRCVILTPAAAQLPRRHSNSLAGMNSYWIPTYYTWIERVNCGLPCLLLYWHNHPVGFEPTRWFQVESMNHYTTVLPSPNPQPPNPQPPPHSPKSRWIFWQKKTYLFAFHSFHFCRSVLNCK